MRECGAAKKQVKKMLRDDIIQLYESLSVSIMVLVKKEGSLHFCVGIVA